MRFYITLKPLAIRIKKGSFSRNYEAIVFELPFIVNNVSSSLFSSHLFQSTSNII